MLPININDIDNILLNKRNRAKAEAERRKNGLFQECPELKRLDDELRALRIEKLRNIRFNNHERSAYVERKLSEARKAQEDLLDSLGYPRDYLEIKYECSKCNDTGYVASKRCECADALVYDIMYRSASLEGAAQQCFENFNLSVFAGEDDVSVKQYAMMEKIYSYCVKYAESFSTNKSKNLIFMGPTGTGKTFLSNCIAGRVLKNRHSVMAISSYALVETLKNASFNGTGELKRFCDVELLVIDELGMEQMLNNVTVEMLFMVINERYRKGYPIIVNTNLTPSQMTNRYTERITSRLFDKEKSTVLGFEGHDVRMKSIKK